MSQSAQQLASVSDIFVGKMPGQNTPATTTMATIEQGMKLFTAVYKRVYRSMAKEFQKLYKLNGVYLDDQVFVDILDEPIGQSDYKGNPNDVVPSADPTAASSQERQQKAQMLMQMIGLGTINPQEVTQRMLVAMEVPEPEKLMLPPAPPPPDPKVEAMKMKAQLDQQTAANNLQMDQERLRMEQSAEANKQAMEAHARQQDLEFKAQEHALAMRVASTDLQHKVVNNAVDTHANAVKASQDIKHKEMSHAQKMQQQKAAQKAKPQTKPKK